MRTLIAFGISASLLGAACAQETSTITSEQPLAGPPVAPAEPAPSVLVREGVTERLTHHVWAIPDGSGPGVPNVGIIVGEEAVMVVDTGMGPRNGETILREVDKIAAGKPIYIVTTHYHPEHDLGASAFPDDALMIRSEAQIGDIEENGLRVAESFAARSDLNAELLNGVDYREADIVFTDEYVVDLGGLEVQLLAMGPNHTPGDTAIFVPSEGVLFSGDIAMRPQPAFASPQSSLSHWLTSLDRLAALEPVHVVPSHGLRGDADVIAGYQTYLTLVRDRVAELKAEGVSEEEALATLSEELAADYTSAGRLAGAVSAAWREAA